MAHTHTNSGTTKGDKVLKDLERWTLTKEDESVGHIKYSLRRKDKFKEGIFDIDRSYDFLYETDADDMIRLLVGLETLVDQNLAEAIKESLELQKAYDAQYKYGNRGGYGATITP